MASTARETSEDSLRVLAARTATLAERFGRAWAPLRSAAGAAQAQELWQRWSDLLPGAGEASLSARLALSGWTPAAARARLGFGRWRKGAALPPWLRVWRDVRARWQSDPLPPTSAGAGRWHALWTAFADVAEPEAGCSGPLRTEFRRLLAARLTVVAGPVLDFEFNLFRDAASRATEWTGEPAADRPEDFVAQLRRAGADLLERNYPVVLRLCCEQTLLLARAWRTFARRLDADRAGLEQRFASSRALGGIVACRGGLSDPHRGAQMAVELRFASGAHVIYKPRPLTLEAGYFSLLTWLGTRGAPRQRSVQVWDRGDYGWMEWIDAAPCRSRAAARRHFTRTGAHLGVLQVLGGSDFHSENWIAAGEFPVPIDLEVLLRPGVPTAAGPGATEESVLGVGLLPTWVGAGGRLANISALGDVTSHGSSHRAQLGARTLSPADFVDDIVRGFRRSHTLLRRHRAALLGARSPLVRLRDAKLRHVARPTEVYGRLLRAATQPRALRDGAAFSVELERVAKALPGMRPAEARMIPEEIAALAALDVPLFQTRARGRALESGERTLPDFFLNTGWAACRRRLRALSPGETARQAALIRAAFAVAALDASQLTPPATAASPRATPRPPRPARPATLLAEAVAIGRTLARQAVPLGRDITWVAPQLLPHAERFQLSPLNAGLYDGTAGVGLFLAALARATGDPAWARLARRVFTPIVAALRDPAARRPLRRLSPGIGTGRAGIVYALTHAAAWLARPEWLAPDVRLIELLQPADHDSAVDILDGAAGAALGALRLATATNDPAALRVAAAWTDRLAPAAQHHGLAGFAHGAAGIASALARIAAETHHASPTATARAASLVAHEQSLFVPDAGNWLDLRGVPDAAAARRAGRFTLAWCHGAPGILLARLSGIQGLDTPAVRADIAAAVRTVLHAPPAGIDQCCCGEAGLIEALECAATVLQQPDLALAARHRAAALLAKARRRGYNAYGPVPLPAGPGFFQGLAGIGYTWLRLAQPGRFPCVLAFE